MVEIQINTQWMILFIYICAINKKDADRRNVMLLTGLFLTNFNAINAINHQFQTVRRLLKKIIPAILL